LLDVDGVLNALKRDRTVRQETYKVGIYTLRLPLGIRDRVAELERHFDMVWSTTWWDEVGYEIVPRYRFGRDWPIIPFSWKVGGAGAQPDKLPDVGAWLAANAPDRPVCWIDDDPGPRVHAWAAARSVPTKLITPDERFGLTDDHVDEAVEWARPFAP
jgi:hypothetical protein